MSLNETPRSNRLHIGIFGKRNSGKSTLINALTGQEISLVSDVAGTTTDPVYKSMELHGIGPCVFIDTAGFDDEGKLGMMRIEKTKEAAKKTDIAIILFSGADFLQEIEWWEFFRKNQTPTIGIVNMKDTLSEGEKTAAIVSEMIGEEVILINARTGEGMPQLHEVIIRKLPEDYEGESITGSLAKEGSSVLLVMPQDIQAPKGRLILPQVQTLRELLDKKCFITCCTTDQLNEALNALKSPPQLIITDSQIFREVYEKKPQESQLTSFSVLFANYKGDMEYYAKSAEAIESLTENSRILIAEACTHAPLGEDIGRVKIPAMLRKKVGAGLKVDVKSGIDFPKDLTPYDLIIQCGACMFNRKYVLNRLEQAKLQHVPMSNYGVVIAYLSGILDKIEAAP